MQCVSVYATDAEMMNPTRFPAWPCAMALVMASLAMSAGGCVLATGAAAGLSGHTGRQNADDNADDNSGPIRPAASESDEHTEAPTGQAAPRRDTSL